MTLITTSFLYLSFPFKEIDIFCQLQNGRENSKKKEKIITDI